LTTAYWSEYFDLRKMK